MIQKELHSSSLEETELLGHNFGTNLRGGEVIELISDLGGGKTSLTRGIAAGFGSPDKVASPSFTLSKEYIAGDKRIAHFDFYRLHEAGIMKDEIAELVNDPSIVTIVEWADVVTDVLPDNRITITITYIDENERSLTYSLADEYSYILEGTN